MTQKLFVYALSPIDHWPGWVRPDDVVVDRAFVDDDAETIRCEVFDQVFFVAQCLAETVGWEGDFRIGPFIAGLPLPEPTEFNFLIAWKQGNNGTTFVASPVPLPHLDGFGAKAEGVVG